MSIDLSFVGAAQQVGSVAITEFDLALGLNRTFVIASTISDAFSLHLYDPYGGTLQSYTSILYTGLAYSKPRVVVGKNSTTVVYLAGFAKRNDGTGYRVWWRCANLAQSGYSTIYDTTTGSPAYIFEYYVTDYDVAMTTTSTKACVVGICFVDPAYKLIIRPLAIGGSGAPSSGSYFTLTTNDPNIDSKVKMLNIPGTDTYVIVWDTNMILVDLTSTTTPVYSSTYTTGVNITDNTTLVYNPDLAVGLLDNGTNRQTFAVSGTSITLGDVSATEAINSTLDISHYVDSTWGFIGNTTDSPAGLTLFNFYPTGFSYTNKAQSNPNEIGKYVYFPNYTVPLGAQVYKNGSGYLYARRFSLTGTIDIPNYAVIACALPQIQVDLSGDFYGLLGTFNNLELPFFTADAIGYSEMYGVLDVTIANLDTSMSGNYGLDIELPSIQAELTGVLGINGILDSYVPTAICSLSGSCEILGQINVAIKTPIVKLVSTLEQSLSELNMNIKTFKSSYSGSVELIGTLAANIRCLSFMICIETAEPKFEHINDEDNVGLLSPTNINEASVLKFRR